MLQQKALLPGLGILNKTRRLDDTEERLQIFPLTPFMVQMDLTEESDIDDLMLADIVTEWMNEEFNSTIVSLGYEDEFSSFDQVSLNPIRNDGPQNRRNLANQIVVARYGGVSLWKRVPGRQPVTAEVVDFVQLAALLEDEGLLADLRGAPPELGFGSAIVEVDVSIDRSSGSSSQRPTSTTTTTGNSKSLEIIIVVAIVVACLAFILLSFAVFWAWHTDRRRRQKHNRESPNSRNGVSKSHSGSPAGTGSDSEFEGEVIVTKKIIHQKQSTPQSMSPPSEIEPTEMEGVLYPESVISEDISTSLSAYYRNGMAGYGVEARAGPGQLNDAASMSSMESYGYSLDGYAPSLSGNTQTTAKEVDI